MCAGDLVALLTLANVLNYLKVQKVDITKVRIAELLAIIYANNYYPVDREFGLAKFKETLKDGCYDRALEKQNTDGYIVLEHGLTMIPLAGLDILFHSCCFWLGVMPFRGCESFTRHAFISLSGPFQIFRRRFPPIF